MQPLGSAPIQIRKPLPPPPGKGAPKNLPVTVPPPGSPPDMPKAAASVQPPHTSLKERGDFHRGRKEFDLALIAYNDALRGMEEGPEKAAILSAMASISVEQKDYFKAQESYTKALAMLVDVYGDDNPSVADIKQKMANLPLPKTDRASQDNKALPAASSSAASGLDNMLSIQNSLPAASAIPAPAQQKTITIQDLIAQLERQKKEHGECHLSVAETQNKIAAFYISKGEKAAEALNLITMSLAIRQKLQGKDSFDHIETHKLCFAAFHANKNTQQGAYHLEEVVRILKKNKKEGTPEFVDACYQVGAVILTSSAKTAKTYFEDGLASQKKIKGNTPDETTATLLKNLAVARLNLAESSKAIPLLEEALAMNQALYKAPHKSMINSFYVLGVCYKQNGQNSKAKENLNKALQMSISLNGDQYPETLKIKKSLT
ncbi:MAG: tetratricopeptide repeat protein [Parachlamydia sp.]|nr:tetratricopeptide repeat protein [Parachlamydia sp.]